MKKKLLLDVDEVIVFSGYLEAVNEFLNTNYKIDDFEDYFIDVVAVPEDKYDEFNKFVCDRNFYANPELLPGAIETIKKLNEVYDIYICSACVNTLDLEHSGKMFADKYDFLIKYLPFLNPEKFIFTNSKHLFNADIQIDDRMTNFKSKIKTKILFPSYHNGDVTDEELEKEGVIRAGCEWREGWKKIEEMLLNNI